MKVHLVDGTYELFRSYFGAPPAVAPDGTEVGATRGILRSLNALLNSPDVTHVAVAFDTVIESFRNELFDGYKTGDGIEPDLWNQFPLAEEGARALGVAVWSMMDFEADDGIAAGAHAFAEQKGVDQVLLCTPDKDLAQCVRGKDVVLWDRRQDIVYDEKGVWEKWGVAPASIPDLLALVGDTADGIPGIPRWGMKSASTLLAHYTHVEKIPEDESEWAVKVRGAAGLAAQLRDHRQEVGLYKTLATLRTDAPVDTELGDIEWNGAHREELEEFCHRIGESGLIGRVQRFR